MSISVVATGFVVEGPSNCSGTKPRVVFVLDPFPGLPGSRVAHACEVVCHGQGLALWVPEQCQCGQQPCRWDPLRVTRARRPGRHGDDHVLRAHTPA
jgi:hypothetical protein